MQLLEELQAEHSLIETVAGSLRTWAGQFSRGEASAADGREFLRFFRVWANDFHHAREEGVLFPALVKEVSLPTARGPIAIITKDHVEMAGLLRDLDAAIAGGNTASVPELAKRYSHHLWHHIDAENSVLFPESEARLVARGVRELDNRLPSPDELDAKHVGEALLERFPPFNDTEVFRGDGCIMCPAYGSGCDGLEREWWTESEWEEIHERLTNM